MGSLCCVAARPHVSSAAAAAAAAAGSRDWSSVGRTESFWRTSSRFSPPRLSRRWDHHGFLSDGLSSGDGPLSSKGSRRHHYSTSDGSISYAGSLSDSFYNQRLTPPAVQGVGAIEFTREPVSEPQTISQSMEGTSGVSQSIGSVSSRSDGSEFETIFRACTFSSRCSFLSKPVHPLSIPNYTAEGDDTCGSTASPSFNTTADPDLKPIKAFKELRSPGWLDVGAPHHWGNSQWSSTSSLDFTDTSEQLELECSGHPYNNQYKGSDCGLCDRLLSQRSPWGSQRIVWSGDMPIVSVLSCCHVYHAECLERATPKLLKHDPPCPLCSEENSEQQQATCRLKNGLPRLKSLGEEGPSRLWTCGKALDCVEGALQAPKQSTMSSLSHSRLKKHLSMKVKGTR